MFLASGEPESSLIIQDPSLLFYLIFFYYMKCFIKFKKNFFLLHFIKICTIFILVLHFIASFYTFYKLWLIHFHF